VTRTQQANLILSKLSRRLRLVVGPSHPDPLDLQSTKVHPDRAVLLGEHLPRVRHRAVKT